MTLADLLVERVMNGDIHDAPWPVEWIARATVPMNEEISTRMSVAATIRHVVDHPKTPTDHALAAWLKLPVRVPEDSAYAKLPPEPGGAWDKIIGKWPGDETDEQIDEALARLS